MPNILWHVALVFTSESADHRVCASGGGVRSSVCLGVLWLVDRSSSPLSALPDLFFLDCLSRVFPVFLTARAFYSGGLGLLRDSDSRSSRFTSNSHVSSLPGSPQHRPHVSISASPFGDARSHNSTRTAIIVCVDSFIHGLTAKHRMLNLSPVTRSCYRPRSSGHGLSS